MKVIDTSLPGVKIVEPDVFTDRRGFFFESYHKEKIAALGITCDFVQDNHSKSSKGILRGFHYQLKRPQAKLCRVVSGEVLDVAVDIRTGSPTFGKSVCDILSAENKKQLFIPRGFAHGFLVLSEIAEVLYKCDEFYHGEDEYGIAWNDPDIGIEWGETEPILSEKDKKNPLLSQIEPEHLPQYVS
ncbi:MAG: dTDP-4-dehydrorhamnose 3,5-epimerase [Nitrospinota bacterium]